MSIWNKVLVGVICVVSVAFFYMAARTLKTHQYWGARAVKLKEQIDALEKQNQVLIEGGENQSDFAQLGIRKRRIELNKLLLDRGRVWFRCDPKVKVSREDGSATAGIVIDNPVPHGIGDNTLLYAFEEADAQSKQKKGHYLGEFKVTKADEKQKTVILVPTLPLSPRQIDGLATAQRPWELYEVLPRDNHDIFASLSDQQKKAMLQTDSLPEYLKDGQPGAADDPADRLVDGRYVRPIRDYQVLFSALNVQHTLLVDQLDATARDLKLVKDALAQAEQQEAAAKQDVAVAKEEVQKFSRQRDAVATYRKTLEQEVAAVKAAITELIENNKAKAGQIAKLQLEAARRIDQRTRAMAQSGAGGS
jgi:hypothetical protein